MTDSNTVDGGLVGTVAVVTGAGQGLGRAHALYLARAGARVVVNDVFVDDEGRSAAQSVVAEIIGSGGQAIATAASVATFTGAEDVVACGVDAFGRVDIVVNNAGVTRHASILDTVEGDWDQVLDVNLKGTFAMTRAAGRHWRARHEAGETVAASIVNTTSRAGLFPGSAAINGSNAGMATYGSSKAAVTALTEVAARELAWLGVRVNAVSPSARTRLTSRGTIAALVAPPTDDSFDVWDPANISPVVAWLAGPQCSLTGEVFWVKGGSVYAIQSPRVIDELTRDSAWTPSLLSEQVAWFDKMHAVRADYPSF